MQRKERKTNKRKRQELTSWTRVDNTRIRCLTRRIYILRWRRLKMTFVNQWIRSERIVPDSDYRRSHLWYLTISQKREKRRAQNSWIVNEKENSSDVFWKRERERGRTKDVLFFEKCDVCLFSCEDCVNRTKWTFDNAERE